MSAVRFRRRSTPETLRADAVQKFASHEMTEAPTRSFKFRRRDGRSHYWFTLTWTPGHLALAGDLGELTLVHYHALRDFLPGITWALSADHGYLMSKTNAKQVYDADRTLRDLRAMLGEEAVHALNGYVATRWSKAEDGTATLERRRHAGYRQDMQAYRKNKADAAIAFAGAMAAWETGGTADAPDREDFEPEPPEDPRSFSRRITWRDAYAAFEDKASLDDLWHIPATWDGWVRVWRQLRGTAYHPEYSTENPDFVVHARNRRLLISEMREELEEPSRAADFLHRIGMDDFYGTYVWHDQTYWQIAAIQHGVRMILAAERRDVDRRESADA